ncbi:hypothetical protein [Anaerosoma tenue]|uniref:hypothetical protein n=1 Tax=Anaerosoma tenue TaxID=2933588 RepID=UPI002260E2BD|nr:hypothetical protein [Anaerosoma tenue]MCK8114910.1 hypothetical protein [Anaerosoma tenue]
MKRTIIISIAVVALVFGAVSYATAASGDTAVTATVGTLLELTAPGAQDLGTIDPENSGSANVTVTGKSNKSATMSAAVAKGNFTTLTSTLETAVSGLRGGSISEADTITGTVDYSVDAGTALSGTVTYSLVQN